MISFTLTPCAFAILYKLSFSFTTYTVPLHEFVCIILGIPSLFYRICSSIPLFPLFSPIFLDNIPICNYFENDYNRYNVHVYWTDMFF